MEGVAGCKRAVGVGPGGSGAASSVEGCRAAETVGKGLADRCYRRVAAMEAARKTAMADAEGQDDLA